MRIHLADTSSNRGQYDLLVDESYCPHLVSYAYRHAALPYFVSAWEEMMRIHFADTTARLHGEFSVKRLTSDERGAAGLFSYAYKEQEEQWKDLWNADMNIHFAGHAATNSMNEAVLPCAESHLTTFADKKEVADKVDAIFKVKDSRPRVIIDSGAFTAWSTGKVIHPQEYVLWALDFESRWRHKMASLEFMNLDVIGDQDATWKNQALIEKLGLNPLPIVTFGVDLKHLDRALENYDYVALGGLVPYSRDKVKLRTWLDACFSRVSSYRKKHGVMRKVHLLGITTDWVLKRYPCYSSDSSSWVSCLRFGGGAAAGLKKIPKYKESEAALSTTIHVLRSEIQKYKKMQDEATKLWTLRGVTWDD